MSDIDAFIQRWRSGDERAAEAIYTQCRGTTYGLAFALLDNSADAEEVMQDVLAYALSHIDRYDPQRARFTTWLHTITVSRCRNKRRRHFLSSVPLFAWLEGGNDEADPAPDLEMRIMQQDEHDEVWAAIGTLSQPLREAILLRHWADYSYQEMAQILGCPLRTAQWGSTGRGDGQLFNGGIGEGIASDAQGNIYVVDRGNFRIQKFDNMGRFLLKWGERGAGPGQFQSPCVVAVDSHHHRQIRLCLSHG